MAVEQTVQQLVNELAQARDQILQLSRRQDEILQTARAELQAAEARLQQSIAQGASSDGRFDIIDFKAIAPTSFYGKRDESWKRWSRRFCTYLNAKKEGFRVALEWAEQQPFEINDTTISRMGWDQSRTANSKLYDFLLMVTGDDALVIVEQYRGMGFEAWRQLSKRFSPSGGLYEMDMMNALMNPVQAKSLNDLPSAIDRFERNLRTYESKTGRQFPPEWKTNVFMKIVPKSHLELIQHRFQMGMRDYETLCSQVRTFSQEAWHTGRGVDDMQVDSYGHEVRRKRG